MTPELRSRIEALPPRAGVYLMKDHEGRVVYIGKAVDLRSRVKSYFSNPTANERAFVGLLDRILADIDVVVVGSEQEALLLENELIKEHQPRFNVKLRDDKDFLLLRLDVTHPYPRLETVRRVERDGARYFGPYASAASLREALRVVNRIFQLRTCSDRVLETRARPCLLYQLGRCAAPCTYPVSPQEYRKNVDAVALFLSGKGETLLARMEADMRAASDALDFEGAARLRDQISALSTSLERQVVATTEQVDQDYFGLYRVADRVTIYVLYVRGGRMGGGRAHHFRSEFPSDELLESFVNQYYANTNFVPPEVMLSLAAPESVGLRETLCERRGATVTVQTPIRGARADLVKLAVENAQRAQAILAQSREESAAVAARLQARLRLSRAPRTIECFDVSHFGGSTIVASQVASVDMKLAPHLYRRFRLRHVTQNDDFASIREVIARRLARGDLPDLIVVDGGKGQLSAARTALRDAGTEHVDMVGLAKSRLLDDEGLRSSERVFLVGVKDPVVLPPNSADLFALTQLRDEAHRFAITYQRKLSRRRGLQSELESIPGVGEARRRELLTRFGSLTSLRAAAVEDIAGVASIGKVVAERIHAYLQQPQVPDSVDEVRDASLRDAEGKD